MHSRNCCQGIRHALVFGLFIGFCVNLSLAQRLNGLPIPPHGGGDGPPALPGITDSMGQVLGIPSAGTQGSGKPSTAGFTYGTVRSVERQDGGEGTVRRWTATTYENGLRMQGASVGLAGGSEPLATVLLLSYEYDAQGRVATSTQAGNLGGNWYGVYSYNDSGRVAEVLWSMDGLLRYRHKYTYAVDLVTLESILEEEYRVSDWALYSKLTHYGYSSGYADSTIFAYWNDSSWVNTTRTIYDKTSLPSEVSWESSYWTGSDWSRSSRNRRTYDTNAREVSDERFQWRGNTWEVYYRDSTTWDSEGVPLQILYRYYYNGSLVDSSFEDFSKYPGPGVTLASPNAGDTYHVGDNTTIAWLAVGVTDVDLAFSHDDGASWTPIESSVPATGIPGRAWQVPSMPSNLSKVRVAAAGNPAIADQNAGPFTITDSYRLYNHSTGTVQMSVFPDGHFGDNGDGVGVGFTYQGGPNALYSGGVIAGMTSQGFKGVMSSFRIQDFKNTAPMVALGPDASADQRTVCAYDEISPIYAMEIEQRTASRAGDPFAFLLYTVKNNSATTWTDFYVGSFADWDIGNYSGNMGGVDVTRGLVYQYEFSHTNDSNFYGIVALSGLSGANITFQGYDPFAIGLWLTTLVTTATTSPGDHRSFAGSGPFSIPQGGQQLVGFAVVAGRTLDELVANADEARAVWDSGVLAEVADDPGPTRSFLAQNYPNPFNPATTIQFTLADRGLARVTVYDLLGREVSTLVSEVKDPGTYTVEFDASGLAGGTYFCRLQAGNFVQTRKLLLVR